MASFTIHSPQHKMMGAGMAGLRIAAGGNAKFTGGPAIWIQGSAGEIQVLGPVSKPHTCRIIKAGDSGAKDAGRCRIPKDPKRDDWGHGMYSGADECARYIRDDKRESDVFTLDESLVISELIDSVLN